MKGWIVLAVGGLVLSGAALAWYRQHRLAELREAYGSAVDAFNRAFEYRDAGVLLYEPRWKDFQTAEDSFRRMDGAAGFIHPDWPRLEDCGHLLEIYRDYSEKESAGIEAVGSIESAKAEEKVIKESERRKAEISEATQLCLKRPF
jgi:hypothetical protein